MKLSDAFVLYFERCEKKNLIPHLCWLNSALMRQVVNFDFQLTPEQIEKYNNLLNLFIPTHMERDDGLLDNTLVSKYEWWFRGNETDHRLTIAALMYVMLKDEGL